MLAAEKELDKKSEIFELWKLMDQVRLLSKLFLNENQLFMLQNRDKKLIINNERVTNEEIKLLDEQNYQNKISKLKEYINLKKEEDKSCDLVDKILIEYLDCEVQEKVIN